MSSWLSTLPIHPGLKLLLLLSSVLLVLPASRAEAQSQTPLFLANEETEVRRISFRFVGSQTFSESRLKEQIATQEPGFFDRVRRIAPLMQAPIYLLDPIELQRDVVRLRRFYNRQGFLNPSIDYPASQLDAESNTIHLIFTVQEGPPLIIESMDFFDPEGNFASTLFEGEMQDRWFRTRDSIGDREGNRYSEPERISIEDEILTWLQEQGYAFASVTSEANVEETTNSAAVRFEIDPGPRAHVGEIIIEGNERIADRTIRRQLPIHSGELYSHRRFIRGQRDLYQMRLFRTVLADVPAQPRDSLVTLRYRVREARPRYLSAETGYSREAGLELSGQWNHRNFFGGARHFTIGSTIRTGLLARPPAAFGEIDAPRLFEFSASLRQPYLGLRGLSGVVRPFLEFERNPLLEPSEEPLGINHTQFGATTQVLYEFFPFRLLTLSYTISSTSQFTGERTGILPGDPDVGEFIRQRDQFSRSVLNLSGTVGQVDDFFERRRGVLVQPFVEVAGALLPSFILEPGVHYLQFGGDASFYFPVTDQIDGGFRLSTGFTSPLGASRDALFGEDVGQRSRFRDRFRNIIFYVGGADDVRGWGRGLLGPMSINPVAFARDENDNIILEGPEGEQVPATVNNRFDPLGGLSEISFNLEARMPFPGLGEDWRLATFLDGGQVSSRLEDGIQRDRGTVRLSPDAFQYGTGVGIRYRTPVGYIRLDLAFKINPDPRDLQNPRDVFLWQNREHPIFDQIEFSPEPPREQFLRRFNVHLSIGQAF